MGHKMGMPSLKLNNAGVKSKSCGSFRSVAEEGLEERVGHDPDIDRERSQQNIYTGYRSAAELMEYSQKHVDQLRDARGRKLRSDAVVMCATVLKPPAAYMATLPVEEQIRLLDVAEGVLAKIVGPENIKATGTHFDEQGTHRHVFWEPMTQDGRLCAKEMHNLQFFAQINREIPAALREAGFEIDDCEMYDAAKEEYEKTKAEAGRSSFQFKADAERAKKEIEQQIGELQGELQNQTEKIADLREEVAVREGMIGGYESRIEDLEVTQHELNKRIEQDRKELHSVSRQVKDTSQSLQEANHKLANIFREVSDLRVEKTELTASVATLEATRDELAREITDLQEAAKREYSAGAQRLGAAEWQRRIADVKERQKKDARLDLLERFIAHPLVAPLWERLRPLLEKERSGKKLRNEQVR